MSLWLFVQEYLLAHDDQLHKRNRNVKHNADPQTKSLDILPDLSLAKHEPSKMCRNLRDYGLQPIPSQVPGLMMHVSFYLSLAAQ